MGSEIASTLLCNIIYHTLFEYLLGRDVLLTAFRKNVSAFTENGL